MKRLERARIIRDKVLAHPREEWRWTTVPGVRFLELDGDGWNASVSTAFNGPKTSLRSAPSYLHARELQQKAAPLPNVLDLWIPGQGKVLAIEWDDDAINLISMQPGPWEVELFGIAGAG